MSVWRAARLLLCLIALPLHAQRAPTSFAFDLDAGLGRTGGGARAVPSAFAFGALAAASLHANDPSGPTLGIGYSAHWPLDYGTDCLVTASSPQCRPTYPKFSTWSALVGWEVGRQRAGGSARMMIGPAAFRTDEPQSLFGVQARLDVTKMFGQHLGLNLWTQGATASPLQSSRFLLASGGVGVRLRH